MADFGSKTVLITGAAKRIGAALACHLGLKGWSVAVHYNTSKAEAMSVVTDIEAAGGKAIAISADLKDEDQTSHLVVDVEARLGPVSALINNASVFEFDDVANASRESWDKHMQVNLRSPFVLAQAFAAALPPGVPGNIINILDQRVINLQPGFTSYTVSKAGLWTLTQTLAQSLAPRIRVNAIGPGPTLPSSRQTLEQFERQCVAQPLTRRVEPVDICNGICFILDAGSLTGQMIALDSGQHLGWQAVKIPITGE